MMDRTAKPRDSSGDGTGTEGGSGSRILEMGKGRGTPRKRQMPFARHWTIHILLGTGSASTDTQEAIDNVLADYNAWKSLKANENYRILETRFEFVTENKLVMYIIYSE